MDLRVDAADLLELVVGMQTKPQLAFDYLRNVAGIDMEALGLEVKYEFYSFANKVSVLAWRASTWACNRR